MLTPGEWGAGHAVRRLGELLEGRGYALTTLDSAHGMLAVKRGRGLGPFFPWTDFIFLIDMDAEGITDAASLEAIHERSRAYGESKMKVPRPLRYRVPNSVTFGVSAEGFSDELIACARRSRHSVNTGEKNAVYLLDLESGLLHSQGLQADTLRYGGTWSPNVNPGNRVARLLPEVAAQLFLPRAAVATDPVPDVIS